MMSRFHAPGAGENLSGGEETRRRIAAALSQGARVLLADEPTSDLDAEGVARLTEALKRYDGALLLVSHDRALLDDVPTMTAELADGKLTLYPGNYASYRAEVLNRRSFEKFEYDQYRQEQARLKKSAQHMVERASQVQLPGRMGNSEARLHRRAVSPVPGQPPPGAKALESRLEKLPEKRRPREDPDVRMEINSSGIVSRVAAQARDLTLRAGDKVLLTGADFRVPAFSRTALVGPNGCGKTTLIRALLDGAASPSAPASRSAFWTRTCARWRTKRARWRTRWPPPFSRRAPCAPRWRG
jgi:macrolide transport system ATP-binding/permease protein